MPNVWYRTGSVSVANGSATVTGVDTTFLTSIYPGDLFTINESVFYEVLSVSGNLTFTLERPYEGETAGGLDYVVVPLSPKRQLTAELANRVNTLIERYRASLEAWTAGGWEIDTNGDMQVSGTEDRDVVPRTNGGANVGTTTKRWGTVNTNALNVNGQAVSPKTTPTAYAVPVADANGDIADGWVPNTIARLASPALTGTPTAPTQAADDDSTKLATTAYVKDQVASDTVTGMVELATSAETLTGTDTVRAVTPKALADTEFYRKGNILGTVSQSDGIPTGAVIERGSNANGEYVKFSDGTMMCSFSATLSNGEYTWTYPAVFAAIPQLTCMPIVSTQAFLYSITCKASSGVSSVTFYGNVSTNDVSTWVAGGAPIHMTSIGRWF